MAISYIPSTILHTSQRVRHPFLPRDPKIHNHYAPVNINKNKKKQCQLEVVNVSNLDFQMSSGINNPNPSGANVMISLTSTTN